ncbi:MAG: hypothetical protein KGL15_06365 [Acidobacteriota bacterium]|nr:hypothetical protein [Acidobacteriota bacterium]
MLRKAKRTAMTLAALGALALGASAVASATTSTTTTSTAAASTTATTTPTAGWTSTTTRSMPANMPAPGTAAHEDAEKAVTGAQAAEVQAAAVKIVGSGTAGAVTTDYQGSGYETTVTKADGTRVEVHLNSSLQEMAGPGAGARPWDGARPRGGAPMGGMPPGAAYGG